jgi:GT2 family glycosyltransferase
VWGAGDETDFLLRLMEGGARLYYDPDLIAMHPDPVPPYDTGARRRAYLYGRGVVEVMKRHRYPAWFKARWLVKPLAAAAIALARLQPAKARYHWSTLLGRLRSF